MTSSARQRWAEMGVVNELMLVRLWMRETAQLTSAVLTYRAWTPQWRATEAWVMHVMTQGGQRRVTRDFPVAEFGGVDTTALTAAFSAGKQYGVENWCRLTGFKTGRGVWFPMQMKDWAVAKMKETTT